MGDEEGSTGLLDVSSDALILSASRLNVKDLAHMAMSCKRLREIAYSDPVWNIQCRLRWPAKQTADGEFQFVGGRDGYLSRMIASQQFRFKDPVSWDFSLSQVIVRQVLLDEDVLLAAQGSNIYVVRTDEIANCDPETPPPLSLLRDHNARINCMRLFSAGCLGTFRNCLPGTNKVLVTCSADHSVRLWGKDRTLRTFRGHTGAVNVIADKLLGQGTLATGGMDCTVKLWSLLGSHRKRTALQATLHGHDSYVKDLVAAGHNPSILISGAKDSKLRVWDVNTGDCVGTARGAGVLTSLHCGGAVCYVSAGSSVTAIDLRTMQSIGTLTHSGGIITTAIAPSGLSLCTGGNDRTAKLWDIRSFSNDMEPFAELGNHDGPVQCVHTDNVKVITGGLEDSLLHVWDARTGNLATTFDNGEGAGASAVASQGARLAIATFSSPQVANEPCMLRYKDFSNCAVSIDTCESGSSKFWDF